VFKDNKYVVVKTGLFIVIDLENTSPTELVINKLYIPEHKFVNIGELVYVTPLSIEYENGGLSKLELNIILPSHEQVGWLILTGNDLRCIDWQLPNLYDTVSLLPFIPQLTEGGLAVELSVDVGVDVKPFTTHILLISLYVTVIDPFVVKLSSTHDGYPLINTDGEK